MYMKISLYKVPPIRPLSKVKQLIKVKICRKVDRWLLLWNAQKVTETQGAWAHIG